MQFFYLTRKLTLIGRSTSAIPQNGEIDVPLVYAYYYFVEALYRYNKMLNNEPLFSDFKLK